MTDGNDPGDRALFERDGSRIVPTALARGPWRPDALHGGAVAALLASCVGTAERTVARFTLDLLAPVPNAPMTVALTEPEGGARVSRQTITLVADDVAVARAHLVSMRQADLDLPAAPVPVPNPFDGVAVPDMFRTRTVLADSIGWQCFDSDAVSVRTLRSPLPAYSTGIFVNLVVPVIAGEPTPTIARAAAAADYGSNAMQLRLPFQSWTFMNAELTVHLARRPLDSWIGVISSVTAEPNGSGTGTAQLYDSAGLLGQAAQALLIEAR